LFVNSDNTGFISAINEFQSHLGIKILKVFFEEHASLINHNFSRFLDSIREEKFMLPEVMKPSHGPQGLGDSASNTKRERHFSGK
jgi:hypothetical protein